MPTKRLPASASIDHLKYQAKDLLTAHAARYKQAAQRIREFHPGFDKETDNVIFSAGLLLSDAQLVIAREYGFPSWMKLRKHVQVPGVDDQNVPHHERIEDTVFRRAIDLLDTGDAEELGKYLRANPDIVHQHMIFEGGNYFRNPTLLEFIAENPVRHGSLPVNIVAVAKVVIEAGAGRDESVLNETLGLVCSGRVPRECGVQLPLIDLLCESGADTDLAMSAALVHGEFDAVERLIYRGARITLPVAAAAGRIEDARRLLSAANREERHHALALAAQFGHIDVVRLLIQADEDINRYNPIGTHSHSTPLHQAALAGHIDVVRLLVQYGARLDLRDTMYQGTPINWAQHAGKTEIEKYLRQQDS